jgi:hypothetical protein
VAFRIVLDHLVLQFNNNEKSQVNMEYRDNIFFFIYGTERCIYTAEWLLCMCVTCLALSGLCIISKNVDATFIILEKTSDIFQNGINGLLFIMISDCFSEVRIEFLTH